MSIPPATPWQSRSEPPMRYQAAVIPTLLEPSDTFQPENNEGTSSFLSKF